MGPCACNEFGSDSDQCDARTGQCRCVSGVTGRACDTCKPRHILTSARSCQNCNDGCVGTLLDSVEILQNHLGSIDLEDLDPAPLRKLTHYTDQSLVLDISVEEVRSNRDQVLALGELESAISSEAELNLLETSKLSKTGETQ